MPEKRIYKMRIETDNPENAIKLLDYLYSKKFEERKLTKDDESRRKLTEQLIALQGLSLEIKIGEYTPKNFGGEFK